MSQFKLQSFISVLPIDRTPREPKKQGESDKGNDIITTRVCIYAQRGCANWALKLICYSIIQRSERAAAAAASGAVTASPPSSPRHSIPMFLHFIWNIIDWFGSSAPVDCRPAAVAAALLHFISLSLSPAVFSLSPSHSLTRSPYARARIFLPFSPAALFQRFSWRARGRFEMHCALRDWSKFSSFIAPFFDLFASWTYIYARRSVCMCVCLYTSVFLWAVRHWHLVRRFLSHSHSFLSDPSSLADSRSFNADNYCSPAFRLYLPHSLSHSRVCFLFAFAICSEVKSCGVFAPLHK